MHKGIIVYVVILIILAIVAYILLTSGGKTTTPIVGHTTTINSNGTATTTVNSTTTKKTTSTVPIINYTNCLSNNATENVENGDFSSGTYSGWIVTGPGFGTTPFNLTYANDNGDYYNQSWSGYEGTFFATTYSGGIDLQAGNLTSKPFIVTEPYLNFKIISPQDDQIYVELLSGNDVVETAHYDTRNYSVNTNPDSGFMNASISIVPLLCENASVRLVSRVIGSGNVRYSYMAAGDFYLSKKSVQDKGILVSQNFS